METSRTQSNYNSSKLGRSPFRATQLWNEAVSILQNGMPTRRHFHRLRYYDSCFSGKEAVEWLTRTLTVNPRFGKNVSTDGTRKLLQHFLKAGVFHSVKGTLTFKESGLFEFVDRTICSPSRKQDNKQISSHTGLKEVDANIPSELRRHPIHEEKPRNISQNTPLHLKEKTAKRLSYQEKQQSDKNIQWAEIILKRIQSLLPSLSVELLVDPVSIHSDWVMYNVCPQYEAVRKRTELPFWVFTAITSVIRSQEKESEYTTYSGFEKDVYNVVRDYLRHRNTPMIPYNLYELIMYTFNHLHYLDLEIKNRSREHNSVENLVLSMSHDWNDEEQLVVNDDLTRTVLPPNSCFETAFTSDEPVTRIVPQSSVDTLCLSSQKSTNVNFVCKPAKSRIDIIKRCDQLTKRSVSSEKIPGPLIDETVCPKYKSRKRTAHLRRTQSMAQIDSSIRWSTLQISSKPSCMPQQQSYINYGLSQSMDDLLVVDDSIGLDFEEAMQSVNCLLQASRGSRHTGTPDLLPSSSLESLSTVDSCHLKKASLICIDSCLWYDDVQENARLVFQSILMLMSPVNRTTLRMLLQFIDQLPVPANSTITKTHMIYELSPHIISPGPRSKNVYSHHMVLSVVYFLVDNCQHIFKDLHYTALTTDKEEDFKENEAIQGPKVYCRQLTKNQFEDQGVTSSWLALSELLDQIISNKKMKSKEKKRRLNKFKEAYPHIYKERFGSSSSGAASSVHFR